MWMIILSFFVQSPNQMISRIINIWNKSIRNQLMIGVALVHAVLMTVFIFDLISDQKVFLKQLAEQQADKLAISLSLSSSSWVLADDLIGLQEVISSQEKFPDIVYAMVISNDARILAHNDTQYIGQYLQDKLSLSLLNLESTHSELKYDTHHSHLLLSSALLIDVVSPVIVDKKVIAWVRVGISQQKLETMYSYLNRQGLFYTLLAIVVGLFFAYILSTGLSKNLLKLVQLSTSVSQGNVNDRYSCINQDEINQVGQAFNQMLDTLAQKQGLLIHQF